MDWCLVPIAQLGRPQVSRVRSRMEGVESILNGICSNGVPFRIFQTHCIKVPGTSGGCDVGEVRGLSAKVGQAKRLHARCLGKGSNLFGTRGQGPAVMGSGRQSLTVLLIIIIINSAKDRTGKGGGAQLPLGCIIYNVL